MLWLSNFTEISYFYAPWKPLFFWRLQMVWKRNMRITTSNIFVLKGRPKHKFFSIDITLITWKVSKYGVFSSPYFPAFGPNTDQKNLRISTLFTQWLLFVALINIEQFSSKKHFKKIISTRNSNHLIMHLKRKAWKNCLHRKYSFKLEISCKKDSLMC